MKLALKLILLIGVVGYLTFTIIKFAKPTEEGVCTGVDILVEDSIVPGFIDKEYISDILAWKKISPEGQSIKRIDLPGIQSIIQSNEYVDTAVCYYTAKNQLCIRVTPRIPILHVIPDKGKAFYLDANSNRLDIGKFNLDLQIATGNIQRNDSLQGLIDLVEYLKADEYWDKEIQQIVYKSPTNIEVIPTTGDHRIIIGAPTDLEDKFSRIRLFYSQGLDKVGWNRYETIDVSYKNQLIAKKKKSNQSQA